MRAEYIQTSLGEAVRGRVGVRVRVEIFNDTRLGEELEGC